MTKPEILQNLLKSDHVMFTLIPVQGKSDLLHNFKKHVQRKYLEHLKKHQKKTLFWAISIQILLKKIKDISCLETINFLSFLTICHQKWMKKGYSAKNSPKFSLRFV